MSQRDDADHENKCHLSHVFFEEGVALDGFCKYNLVSTTSEFSHHFFTQNTNMKYKLSNIKRFELHFETR